MQRWAGERPFPPDFSGTPPSCGERATAAWPAGCRPHQSWGTFIILVEGSYIGRSLPMAISDSPPMSCSWPQRHRCPGRRHLDVLDNIYRHYNKSAFLVIPSEPLLGPF